MLAMSNRKIEYIHDESFIDLSLNPEVNTALGFNSSCITLLGTIPHESLNTLDHRTLLEHDVTVF